MAFEIKKTPYDSPEFLRMFTIFVMKTLLCPTNSADKRRNWTHVVGDVNGIVNFDFAKFTLESTIRAIAEFKRKNALTTLGGYPLFLMAIFCEYSPKSGLQNVWKYELPRIIDWTNGNTKTLHELILKLAQGYKTNRMVAVIDNDKDNIVGKVPSAEVRIVEKALNEVRDVMGRVNSDMNRLLGLILSHLEDHRGDFRDDASENTEVMRKMNKGKSTVEESDFEDEKQQSSTSEH